MSYRISFEIKELKLRIPKEDFPMKSDVIVGFEYPKMLFEEDENCYEDKEGRLIDEHWTWDLTYSGGGYDNMGYLDELETLCQKYGGTLIMDVVGEDDEVTYVRIRDGKKKTVRIVEED